MNRLHTRGRFWADFSHGTAGFAAVELALVAPVLIILLIGAWDFGRLTMEHSRLFSAANAGAQFGMQFPNDTAAIENVVRSQIGPTGDQASVTLNSFCECQGSGTQLNCDATTCPGLPAKFLSVEVRAPFETLLSYPWLPNPVEISEQIVIRTQNTQ